jgi:hypothetical protein
MPRAPLSLAAALALLPTARAAAAPALAFSLDGAGGFAITLDTQTWFQSPSSPPSLCVGGARVNLTYVSSAPTAGADAVGAWTGTAVTRAAPGGAPRVVETFKAYAARPDVLVATASFPDGVDAGAPAACGGVQATRTAFPRFDAAAGAAGVLGYLSWSDAALSHTNAAVGLAALGQNSLDAGPVVAFLPPLPGVPHPGLAWSTLDAHKVVTQTTSGGGGGGGGGGAATPAAVTALWSSARADQVACLSAGCAHDQVADGAYVTQRVEGWALSSAPGAGASACLNGAVRALTPLDFAWNARAADNFVGAAGTAPAGYEVMGGNGFVLAAAAPGAVPLRAFFKAYNATHNDWAAVASTEGLAWAAAAGYADRGVIGYVFTAAPTVCAAGAGAGAAEYSLGLSAAVPAIPAGWNYSVIFVGAYGGPTATTYALGDTLRAAKNTTRLPSVTLTDIGYYTDDGAYYYVWEAFNIPPRPWAAEVGLQLVKEDLYAKGVPVAYMQLDDWCVQRARHAVPACSARLQHPQLRPLQPQHPNLARHTNPLQPPGGTLASFSSAMSRASRTGTRRPCRASFLTASMPLRTSWAFRCSSTRPSLPTTL